MVRDSGDYECQVSGPKHTSISKLVSLTVIGAIMMTVTLMMMMTKMKKIGTKAHFNIQARFPHCYRWDYDDNDFDDDDIGEKN